MGYADGIPRRLGNGIGFMSVRGVRVPIVGNVCMDMCMVDVTDIPVDIDDEVIVFGPEHPVQKYARDLGTIHYEALTSISPRVRRVYVQG